MEGSGSKFEFMHEMPKEAESKDFDLGEISKSDHRKKAEELIGGGESELVAQHLDQFAYLDHKHIANLILEQGNDFILAKYLNNFEDLDQSIADKLIKAGEGKSVVKNISSFNVLEHRHIAERLINAGEGAIVAENLEKFYHDLDYKDLAKKLIKKGQIESLGKYLEKFQGLDAEIAEKLCRESVGFHIAENISSFSPLDHQKIANILINWKDSWRLVENLEKFQGIDYQEIALSIINRLAPGSGIVAEHLDKFKGVDRLLIADEMIKHSSGYRVLEFLDNFGGLKAIDVVRKMMSVGHNTSVAFECFSYLSEEEKKEIAVPLADRLIKTGYSYEVPILFDSWPSLNREEVAQKLMIAKDGVVILEQSDKFPGMDLIEVAKVIIAEGQVKDVAKNIDKLPKKELSREFLLEIIERLIDQDDFSAALEINGKFNYPDQDLVRAVDVFGGFVTKDNYRFMKQLLAGELTPEQEKEAKILGIEKTGADGIQELRAKLKNFTSEVLTMDGPNPDLLLQSDILKDFMKSFVRFSGSRFGEHGEDKFLNTIKYFEQIKEKAKKLNEEYRPSHIITIQAIDQAKQAQIEISEQGLNRFKTFQDALREAVRLYDHPEALMPILQKIQEKLDVKKMDLEQKQANLSNEKARASIQKNIDALNSIQLDANTNWQETFSKLISFKNEFRDELLTAVFWWSLKIKPDSIGAVKELIEKETPAFNDLSQALDFIDHITNRETLKKFFIDTKAAKNFDYLLNVSALQDELARLQNQESKGTMKMQFVPGRNLLTEFSGHIADACWASKYPSIIEEFPNFTSLMMVLNPDNPQTRRLAGAAFLIETTAEDGRELLIIRGLNPQENVINSLKVNDFYKKITEYLKEIAGSMGRELAIVIDDHSGGSASNRPVLYNHLSGLQEKLQKIKPAHDEDTTFNGYHIQDNIYLV